MNLLNKNQWLNFFMGMLGFYSVYAFVNNLLADFKINLAQTVNVSVSYYWLVAYLTALAISLLLTIIFCKPRSPWVMALAILCAGFISMYRILYLYLTNLDRYFHQDGLAAMVYLLPHLTVIAGAFIAFLIGIFSNLEPKSTRSAASV